MTTTEKKITKEQAAKAYKLHILWTAENGKSAKIQLNGIAFFVNIVDGKNGKFISFPAHRRQNGEYEQVITFPAGYQYALSDYIIDQLGLESGAENTNDLPF